MNKKREAEQLADLIVSRSRSADLARDIREYLATPGSDPLAATILPPGESPSIGPESCSSRGGIRRCKSPHGSTRYLRYDAGEIVAGLQVVSPDGREAVIANVYTRPNHRGHGLGSALVAAARQDFRVVRWPGEEHLSIHGKKLRDKTESQKKIQTRKGTKK